MLPIFHVKSTQKFWKISVQFLKTLHIKTIHDHDTLPGALVQHAVVISTPRGNDERKYPGSVEWQSQDE
jgi:hypothetical protein